MDGARGARGARTSRRHRRHGEKDGEDKFDMWAPLSLDDLSKPSARSDHNQVGLG